MTFICMKLRYYDSACVIQLASLLQASQLAIYIMHECMLIAMQAGCSFFFMKVYSDAHVMC